MNPSERRQLILDRLEQEGSGVCSYETLAAALKVSSMTVRRDLGELLRLGTVIRTGIGSEFAGPDQDRQDFLAVRTDLGLPVSDEPGQIGLELGHRFDALFELLGA